MNHAHDLGSAEIDGNTFWFCWTCGCRLQGTPSEFPDMTPQDILMAFFAALPEKAVGEHE